MTLEEVKAALAPFARFAELFTHNVLGVNHDNFYSKDITVNGEFKEFKISGADFDRAKDAYDFLSKIDPSKQPQAGPEHDPNAPVVELTGTQGAAPELPTTNAPAEATTGLADPADATTAEAEAEAEAETATATAKKGKAK